MYSQPVSKIEQYPRLELSAPYSSQFSSNFALGKPCYVRAYFRAKWRIMFIYITQGVGVMISSLMEKENGVSWKQLKDSQVNSFTFNFRGRLLTTVGT